jgi:CubicO group peptidase (beta-lactamase class C family)
MTEEFGARDLVLRQGKPQDVGMSAERLIGAARILEAETTAGTVLSAALLVARHGVVVLHHGQGRVWPGADGRPAHPETVYLIGSITKPMVAAALMKLVENEQVSLSDPVQKYVPELVGMERGRMRIKDILAHTSGLPDQLPENEQLRIAHAPLPEFLKRVLTTPLLFTPGTSFSYQSMGLLLAAEIVERFTRKSIRDVLHEDFFAPLGMRDTTLGLGQRPLQETAFVQGKFYVGSAADDQHCGMNSPYWRATGNPWGGVHSTVRDVAVFLQMFLNGGTYNKRQYFRPTTVEAMTTDQNNAQQAPWGLGWAVKQSKVWNYFGDHASARTFGHVGIQGNTAWADPQQGLVCVILTSYALTLDGGALVNRVSRAVQEALVNPL